MIAITHKCERKIIDRTVWNEVKILFLYETVKWEEEKNLTDY